MCLQSFFDILCYLESFFHIEEEESAHVDPRAAGYCLERVLDESSVARLVVSGVEAVLEDACPCVCLQRAEGMTGTVEGDMLGYTCRIHSVILYLTQNICKNYT